MIYYAMFKVVLTVAVAEPRLILSTVPNATISVCKNVTKVSEFEPS